MKRAVVLLLAVFLLATAAMSADQNSWRVRITADNGSGQYFFSTYVGVYPTSVDGLDNQDGIPVNIDAGDMTGILAWILAEVPGQSSLYSRSIKAPTFPSPEKTWDLYIAGNLNYDGALIRLRASTVNTQLPPDVYVYNGVSYPLRYFMRMVDNKGIEGAPANGTMWQLPIPTVHSTDPYWTSPLNLPTIRLSAGDSAHLLAEGYKLQFVQMVVPEPSGLLALGGGLIGLASFFRRRK